MQMIFEQGKNCDIKDVLDNRDWRASMQTQLAKKHCDKTIVSVKLNIPGPIKNNGQISQFFKLELKQFEQKLQQQGILYSVYGDYLDKITGPERFYGLDDESFHVKHLTTCFEDSTTARRLFDIDVFVQSENQIRPISRAQIDQEQRKCLICGRPAKECGRARKHSVKQLQQKVSQLISETLKILKNDQKAQLLAQLGVQAMLDEVMTWPKPGLVDPLENGAHPDMDHFLFVKSALSLESYLFECAQIGLSYTGNKFEELFDEIRRIGKVAESDMFKVTNGINTHKGVVFSLGVMETACGIAIHENNLATQRLQQIIQQMLQNLVKNDLQDNTNAHTAGEKQYQKYHLGGVRAEAASGYHAVFEHGLKTYHITQNLPQNDQYIVTLMDLARHTNDSTLIKRAQSPQIIEWKNQQIDHFFDLGATVTEKGRDFLMQMQANFSKRHLSLGGSADLLILTIFIANVERRFANGLSN